MSRDRYPPFDLSGLDSYSLRDRTSKVSVDLFAGKPRAGASFAEFAAALPDILAAGDLKELVRRIVAARAAGRPVVLGMGAHVIKVGLSPIIIHLLETGVVTAIAMNGAGIANAIGGVSLMSVVGLAVLAGEYKGDVDLLMEVALVIGEHAQTGGVGRHPSDSAKAGWSGASRGNGTPSLGAVRSSLV